MPLTAGTKLGAYEIVALIGAGGMGEVYRARDTRLNRDIAIKVLPRAFSTDAERLHRFEQEALAVARLNHPNILVVHDIGSHEGAPYVVSELLEGETLRERLTNGAIPTRKVIEYGIQIARGLGAAHEKGIVHRDLKPENILVMTDGRLKILDFGLAKLIQTESAMAGATNIPTTPPLQTQAGLVLGTLGYMSPEQVRGLAADHRADIFAFGAVLYEMLAGHRAFQGDTAIDSMTAILKEDPADLPATERQISPALARIVDRCLEKQAALRFQTASDLAFALEGLTTRSELSEVSAAVAAIPPRRSGERLAWILAAVALSGLVGVSALAAWLSGRAPPPPEKVWLSILPPVNSFGLSPAPALSPDGSQIAFAALDAAGTLTLWVRRLDSPAARMLPETQDARNPFWSPDSQSIAFFALGKLKKVDLAGGSPQILADTPNNRGGAWTRDGIIVFAPTPGRELSRIDASGGAVTPVTRLDEARREIEHLSPHFLPDGRRFLYWAQSVDDRHTGIYAGSLDSREVKFIAPWYSRAEYANGYLLFGRERDLMAQAFDLQRLALAGDSFRVAENVGLGYGNLSSYAFSASPDGGLAYWGGSLVPVTRLTVYDRQGHLLGHIGDPGEHFGFALAPDEASVALERRDPKVNTINVWRMELATGRVARVTSEGRYNGVPIWSPDGSRIIFGDDKDRYHIKEIRSERLERVTYDLGAGWPSDWSPDGQYVVVALNDPQTNFDIWLVPLDGKGKGFAYLQTNFDERMADVSPDGRWLAYASNETGQREIYVDSFPKRGNKIAVSTGGGIRPTWRKDGRELFYFSPDQKLMAVAVSENASGLKASAPTALFVAPQVGQDTGRAQYAPLGNGDRFLFNALAEQDDPKGINVVLNWTAGLKQ